MKNKILVSCILLLLIPIATADVELKYDNENFFGGLLINDDYSARVRFTSTVDGELSQVKLHWYSQPYCCGPGSKIFILVNYTGYTVTTGSYEVNCNGWQFIPISNFPVYNGGDFYVEVHKSNDSVSHSCLSMGNDTKENRSEQYGYFSDWTLVDEVLGNQSWPPCELGIRAIISTEPTPTTTTTIPYRPPKDGDDGGPYGPNRTKTCYDGIRNCHHGSCESGIDCGGPCLPCPSCFDGIQNQGEEGVDCGGPCPPCPTTTTTTTIAPTTTLPQCPRGCECLTEAEAKERFEAYEKCIEDVCGYAYTQTPITVIEVPKYCFREVPTTTTTIEVPQVVGRVVAFPPGGIGALALLILLLLLLFFFYKRKKKKEEEEG